MSGGARIVEVVLLFAGVSLGALGQYYFTFLREYPWDGALFWGAGLLLLGAAYRRLWRGQRRPGGSLKAVAQYFSSLKDHPLEALAGGLGLALSVVAGLQARQRPPTAGFGDLLAAWLVGAVGFVGTFAWSTVAPPSAPGLWARRGELGRWFRENYLELVGLTLLVVGALTVRGFDLEHIPANFSGDEGTQAAEALKLIRPPLGNPFTTGWLSVPTMSFLAYGVSMSVFGDTVAGLRALSALIGTGTVLVTYLLARDLWGDRIGWLSAAFLAGGHYHIHFSRLGSNQIADGLLMTLALLLLTRGLRNRQTSLVAAAGAVAGLGWYGYFGARLIGVVLIGYAALQALVRHRFLKRHRASLVAMLAAAAVVLAPLLLHYMASPGDLMSRPRQVSIFASGWLAGERELTGRTTVSLLLQQLWKSISAFNYTLDPTYWYGASIPLLDVISGLFFVLGLLWVLAHYRWSSNTLLLTWLGLAVLLGWVVTENPPSSQRLVGLAPALAVVVALGLDQSLGTACRILGAPRVAKYATLVVLLTAIVGLNLGYYFLEYTPRRAYGNPTAEMATHLSRYLASQNDDYIVYLHGPPFVYWDFGTFRFMAREVTGVDIPPLDQEEAPKPAIGEGGRFVFHPARADEMEIVREDYPGGEESYVASSANGELLYAMYEIHPGKGSESGNAR